MIVHRLLRNLGMSYDSHQSHSAVTACSFYTDWAGIKFYQVHKSLTCFRFMKNNTRPAGVLLHVNQA